MFTIYRRFFHRFLCISSPSLAIRDAMTRTDSRERCIISAHSAILRPLPRRSRRSTRRSVCVGAPIRPGIPHRFILHMTAGRLRPNIFAISQLVYPSSTSSFSSRVSLSDHRDVLHLMISLHYIIPELNLAPLWYISKSE